MPPQVRPIRIVPITKTTAQWAADVASPFPTIIECGELGCEYAGSNSVLYKGGNGIDSWSGLNYIGAGPSTNSSKIITCLSSNINAGGAQLYDSFFANPIKAISADSQMYVLGRDFTQNTSTQTIQYTNGGTFANNQIILALN